MNFWSILEGLNELGRRLKVNHESYVRNVFHIKRRHDRQAALQYEKHSKDT